MVLLSTPSRGCGGGEWGEAMTVLEKYRLEHNQSTQGLFQDDASKAEFCVEAAKVLRERAEDLGDWKAKDACLVLKGVRMLMCERDASIQELFEAATMSAYARFAAGGMEFRSEALKCLNNALYDAPATQRTFCELPEEQGRDLLAKAVKDSVEDLGDFHRASFVVMYLAAGEQEPDASDVSLVLGEACIEGTLEIATKHFLEGNELIPFPAVEDRGEAAREAVIAGLKAIYAIAVTKPSVLQSLVTKAEEQTKPIPDETVEEALAKLTLVNSELPILDRLGLLLVNILQIKESSSDDAKDEDAEALAKLKTNAITVLMISCAQPKVCNFMVLSGAVDTIAELLDQRMAVIVSEPSSTGVTYFSELLPILILCTNLAQNSVAAKNILKKAVFSKELPLPELEGLSPEEVESTMNEVKMKGITPRDILGGRLISLMVCLESNIKRYSGELLYTLCDEDAAEMTKRCGYGSSAHILAIKGGTIGQIIAQQEAQEKARNESKQTESQ